MTPFVFDRKKTDSSFSSSVKPIDSNNQGQDIGEQQLSIKDLYLVMSGFTGHVKTLYFYHYEVCHCVVRPCCV